MIKLIMPFFLVSTIVCGQPVTETGAADNNLKTTGDWKILELPNFSIEYPSGWDLDQSGQMGTSFILFSPLESEKDAFRENVNLLIQDLTGYNIDLNSYTEISEQQIKTMVTNSTLFESKRVNNGNQEYHKIIYAGDQGIFRLKFEQYYWVISDKAYVLTLTCQEHKYEDFKAIGEKIINSFKLK